MNRMPLDLYDEMPKPMRNYITHYGWHFNKEAFLYAQSLMYKKDAAGKETPVKALSKSQVKEILEKHDVVLKNDILYDSLYVYHMGVADYLGSSIPDEAHLALYVKDTVDDVDAASDTTFRRWVAT